MEEGAFIDFSSTLTRDQVVYILEDLSNGASEYINSHSDDPEFPIWDDLIVKGQANVGDIKSCIWAVPDSNYQEKCKSMIITGKSLLFNCKYLDLTN